MDEMDLAEYNSRKAAEFSYDGVLQARQRAHQLLLVLLGGGAGLGALGLERVAHSPALAGAALAASALWFALARQVVDGALVTSAVRSWAQGGLLEKYAEWVAYNGELLAEGKPTVDPLASLRASSVRAMDKAASEYREVSRAGFATTDAVQRHLTATPLAAALGALAGWALQRWA